MNSQADMAMHGQPYLGIRNVGIHYSWPAGSMRSYAQQMDRWTQDTRRMCSEDQSFDDGGNCTDYGPVAKGAVKSQIARKRDAKSCLSHQDAAHAAHFGWLTQRD
jgi:hypothetical protein